ncbi:Bcr/CflA family multidrug efflux MFS transporter [Croceicoccus sediminis]|uniref:Bcr/CflA family multidrug efflux MFS transporter n=1 Tax=Croceicoccus sediminis TaxID=2571150 RepID=UPI001182AE78|nr:Bcr/CflA family multidrug efflux MFS transporter [Croceicoccus sediminis]
MADGVNNARTTTDWRNLRLLAILSALIGFASISTDLYLPAMPAMARALNAGLGATEWTVSGYLVGFCIGQLIWGPLGDRYGRRIPVACGIGLFVIGSAACALSQSIEAVIAARSVQALGASAGVVLGRAMIRDLYTGARVAEMMSTLMTVMALAPLIGPLLGGQILLLGGWRTVFWCLAGFGLLILATLLTLPETLPPARRQSIGLGEALGRYAALLKDRRILAYTGAGGFFYAGMFAYIAGSPFAYIDYHGLPPQDYGWLFGLNILGIMTGTYANARLVRRYGADAMLKAGLLLAAIAGLAVAIVTMTDLGGLPGLVVGLFFYTAPVGFVIANSLTGAMEIAPHRAGAVSALVGALQYGCGIFSSLLVGVFADGTPRAMGVIVFVSSIAALGSAMFLRRSHVAEVQNG